MAPPPPMPGGNSPEQAKTGSGKRWLARFAMLLLCLALGVLILVTVFSSNVHPIPDSDSVSVFGVWSAMWGGAVAHPATMASISVATGLALFAAAAAGIWFVAAVVAIIGCPTRFWVRLGIALTTAFFFLGFAWFSTWQLVTPWLPSLFSGTQAASSLDLGSLAVMAVICAGVLILLAQVRDGAESRAGRVSTALILVLAASLFAAVAGSGVGVADFGNSGYTLLGFLGSSLLGNGGAVTVVVWLTVAMLVTFVGSSAAAAKRAGSGGFFVFGVVTAALALLVVVAVTVAVALVNQAYVANGGAFDGWAISGPFQPTNAFTWLTIALVLVLLTVSIMSRARGGRPKPASDAASSTDDALECGE
jgi:hypothetical protein